MGEVELFFENMQRCTKCILPETFPGIEFDENGECNYCKNYEPIKVLGDSAFEELISKYRNKGNKYDCIAPISGGRDSCYVLHQMVKRYDMRVMTLTVDSGAIMPEGYRNIEKAVNVLGVPHVWIKDQKQIETSRKNTRIKFQGWLKKPSINTIVPVLNAGDKTMNLRMARYAHDHGIPLILGGNILGTHIIEHDHFKTGYMGVFCDDHGRYTKLDTIKLMILFGYEYLKNPANFRFPILKEYLQGFGVYFYESLLTPKDVDAIGFYDCIYWEEKKVLQTIYDELDWEGASDTVTTWRIDDAAYPLINYIYLRLVGFTEHCEMFSKMIREGQISRGEALQRCLEEQKPRIPSIMNNFEDLGVTREHVDTVLERYRLKVLKRILKDQYAFGDN